MSFFNFKTRSTAVPARNESQDQRHASAADLHALILEHLLQAVGGDPTPENLNKVTTPWDDVVCPEPLLPSLAHAVAAQAPLEAGEPLPWRFDHLTRALAMAHPGHIERHSQRIPTEKEIAAWAPYQQAGRDLVRIALIRAAEAARGAPREAAHLYRLDDVLECDALTGAQPLYLMIAVDYGVCLRYAPLPVGGGLDAYLLGPQALRR